VTISTASALVILQVPANEEVMAANSFTSHITMVISVYDVVGSVGRTEAGLSTTRFRVDIGVVSFSV
jgi:hypothetical protein